MFPIVSQRLEKLMHNLLQDFDLEKLSKAPARFNQQKLDWFNARYIKMLSLDEFALRGSLFKLNNFTIESYDSQHHYFLFPVDLQKELILVIDNLDFDIFRVEDCLLGGEKLKGLIDRESLCEIVKSQTQEKLILDQNKLTLICSYQINSSESDGISELKNPNNFFHIFFYPLNSLEIPQIKTKNTNNQETHLSWISIQKFLEKNNFLNYPIWRNFCFQNKFEKPKASRLIKQQYLAWLLDKQRITVLQEFGMESGCILNYQEPKKSDLQWKKISLEESLRNLEEIFEFLKSLLNSEEWQNQQINLFKKVFSTEIEEIYYQTVKYLEEKIKTWLKLKNYQAGNYLWPLRVALSGQKKSPSPFELLAILELKQTNSRLQKVLA